MVRINDQCVKSLTGHVSVANGSLLVPLGTSAGTVRSRKDFFFIFFFFFLLGLGG